MDLQEITQLYNFRDKTIIISGGAGVLGGEMACALVGCGANVVILDRDPERAERLSDRLGCYPGCSLIVYADVLNKDSLEKALKVILKEFKSVDGLINAAGGNSPHATTNEYNSFFDLPEGSFRQVVDLNLLGTILPSQVFVKAMLESGEGAIINISSMNAYRPLTRVPAYSAAKAAVSNFTRWLAVHIAKNYSPKIRVNALAPGFFHTKQNHYLLYNKNNELTERGKRIVDHTPVGRFGDPEDLLGATLWLLSPASKFVTGIVIPIDGGFSAFSGV
jgi:NAD(P)-dependent dehydrogenase (short-subunit alcohol dehydrogenase family)